MVTFRQCLNAGCLNTCTIGCLKCDRCIEYEFSIRINNIK